MIPLRHHYSEETAKIRNRNENVPKNRIFFRSIASANTTGIKIQANIGYSRRILSCNISWLGGLIHEACQKQV
jgi:hypothetical protein